MPTRGELIAHGREVNDISRAIGADGLVYQQLDDLKQAIIDANPMLTSFDSACFDKNYLTGDVDDAFLDALEDDLRAQRERAVDKPRNQMDLQFSSMGG